MLKVIHCPFNVGSHPSVLSAYEQNNGLTSNLFVYQNSLKHVDRSKTIIENDKGFLFKEYITLKFSYSELLNYDVIHYNFGSTVTPYKKPYDPFNDKYPDFLKNIYLMYFKLFETSELNRVKKNNKKIFVTYQGDDGRIGSIFSKNNDFVKKYAPNFMNRLLEIENTLRRKNRIFEEYAERIFVLNPDLMNYFSAKAEFLPYASFDIWKTDIQIVDTNNEKIIIGHAPTHREVKGTKYIIEAVNRLIAEGYKVELRLIENICREKAIEEYKKFDLAIDQIILGWYGGFALELMAMSKPVICYINQNDLKHIPEDMKSELPIINADVNNLYDVLKKYISTEKYKLKEIGLKSREYVENWHDPDKIAKKMKHYYSLAFNGKS